jgi:uncharacterized protein
MLRRPLSWLAVAVATLAVATACRQDSHTAVSERPLLWAAQKDGQTTYLLGTMHIGFNAEKQLPRWVWDKVRASRSFAIETDISDPALMQTGWRRDGRSLRDELGDVYWKKLEKELGGNASATLNMTPAAVTSLLEIKGLPPAMPMDLALLGEAEAADKKVVFLEEAALQVALLEKWITVDTLRVALDDRASGKTATKDLLAAYVAGDTAKLEALADGREVLKKAGRSDAEYDAMMEELLYRRNEAWIAPIEKMHAQGDAMVAVGAMHLLGKRSVLELLQARGFQITRVTSGK